MSETPNRSNTSPVATRSALPGSTSVRRMASANARDFDVEARRCESHAVIGANPSASPVPVSRTAPGTSTALAEPPDGSSPIALSVQYPPMTPRPGTSRNVPNFLGALRSPVRRTLMGDNTDCCAPTRLTIAARTGQPNRHAINVVVSGRPSAGYQRSPGRPMRAMDSFTARYPRIPRTAPRNTATTLSPALTRNVSFLLSPTSRRAARRRARDSLDSRAQTERKMVRGSNTMHPRVNRRMSRVDGSMSSCSVYVEPK